MTNSTAKVQEFWSYNIGVNWVLEPTTKEQNVESTFTTKLRYSTISKGIFDSNLMMAYKLALTQWKKKSFK